MKISIFGVLFAACLMFQATAQSGDKPTADAETIGRRQRLQKISERPEAQNLRTGARTGILNDNSKERAAGNIIARPRTDGTDLTSKPGAGVVTETQRPRNPGGVVKPPAKGGLTEPRKKHAKGDVTEKAIRIDQGEGFSNLPKPKRGADYIGEERISPPRLEGEGFSDLPKPKLPVVPGLPVPGEAWGGDKEDKKGKKHEKGSRPGRP